MKVKCEGEKGHLDVMQSRRKARFATAAPLVLPPPLIFSLFQVHINQIVLPFCITDERQGFFELFPWSLPFTFWTTSTWFHLFQTQPCFYLSSFLTPTTHSLEALNSFHWDLFDMPICDLQSYLTLEIRCVLVYFFSPEYSLDHGSGSFLKQYFIPLFMY